MVVAVLGLCCCGAGVIGNLSDGDRKPQSQVTEAAPRFVTTPSPTRPISTKPSPTRSQKPVVKASPTKARPKPSPTRKRTTAPTTDKRYGTCKAANDAGLGPYFKGVDPEYYWYDDRDDDGKVCERR